MSNYGKAYAAALRQAHDEGSIRRSVGDFNRSASSKATVMSSNGANKVGFSAGEAG